MGVTIHYAIGLQSGRAKRALDRTQALAEDIRREQAAPLSVPFAIRRQSPTTLRIDMGQCETLAFDFNAYESYLKTDESGRPVWSYGHSVLPDLNSH
jgi:hypothetical protein